MTDESGKQTVGIPTCRAKAAPGAVAPNQSTAQKPRDTKQVAQARLCPREEGALPSFFPSHRTGGTEPPVSESTKKVDSWLKRRESVCVLGGSRGKSPPANAEEAETPGTSRCSEASDFRCTPWGLKPRPCHCTPPTARRPLHATALGVYPVPFVLGRVLSREERGLVDSAQWRSELVPSFQNIISSFLQCPHALLTPPQWQGGTSPMWTTSHLTSWILLTGGQFFTPATSHLGNSERGKRGRHAAGAPHQPFPLT